MVIVKNFNLHELVARGQEIYEQRLKSILEPAHHDQFVAIEVESGDYFIGKTGFEAVKKARAKHPDKVCYRVKIGFRAARKIRR